MIAYARGFACERAKDTLIKGMMVAVGLSKEQINKILPAEIYVACRNSSKSVTISGPEKETKTFLEKLQSEGIFAKPVDTGNIAFHSKYVSKAGKYLIEFLKSVIKKPQPRSRKWISTSVLPSQKCEEWAEYNGPEYHYNNFCNTVLFDQVFERIPENAIVIEVGPHGLLQPILKSELCETVTVISTTDKRSNDNETFFLSAIGKYVVFCFL